MSEKVIKISSQQGFSGTFGGAVVPPSSLNLVDFVIPSGLNVDLSRSYMSFNSQINNSTNDTPINARWTLATDGARNFNVPTAALIKNAHVRNNRGMVESVRNIDTLACGLWGLTNSAETRKNDLNTFSKYVDGRGVGNFTSVQLAAVTDNTDPAGTGVNTLQVSENVARDIKIPLSDIFGLGGAERYSSSIMGETRIHCETNFSLLDSEHIGGDEATSLMFDGTSMYGGMEGTTTLAAGAEFGATLETTGSYGDWQYVMPFFEGQQILLNFDAGDAGATTPQAEQTRTIVSIKYQGDNTATPPTNTSKVFITLDANIYTNPNGGGGAAQTVENILIKYDKANLTLQNVINRAELCLYTIPDDGDMPNSLTFPTYTTEADNGNDLTSFNRQYVIEPEADAVLIACCDANNVLPTRSIDSYRYAINQEEQTGNRDIEVCSTTKLGSPLQYDRLQRCLDSQIGVGLRNAHLRFYQNDQADPLVQADVYSSPITMICETLDTSAESKMLNLNIECTDPLKKLLIFKHMYKTI